MNLRDRINTFGSIGCALPCDPYKRHRGDHNYNTTKPKSCPVPVVLCEDCTEPDCTFNEQTDYQREARAQRKLE